MLLLLLLLMAIAWVFIFIALSSSFGSRLPEVSFACNGEVTDT